MRTDNLATLPTDLPIPWDHRPLLITAIQIPLVNILIKRVEEQLEQQLGEAWIRYQQKRASLAANWRVNSA